MRSFYLLVATSSINAFGLHLSVIGQSDLGTFSKESFQKFCATPSTQQYRLYADFLSKLPIINGTLIDSCWFITAAHTFGALTYFYGQEYVNQLRSQGIPFQGNQLIVEKTICHPKHDLILVKIKPTNISPVERFRGFDESERSDLEKKVFFSRTIHYGDPLNVSSINPDIAKPLDRSGFFACLKFQKTDGVISNYKTEDILGVKVRSYTGDSGSPLLNISLSVLEDGQLNNGRVKLLGVAVSMGDNDINVIKLNQPEVNEWIDYTILSEVLN